MVKNGEWFASICIMCGSLSLAFEYIVVSTILYFIGSCSWAFVGWAWKKYSVVAMNIVVAGFFIIGWIW